MATAAQIIATAAAEIGVTESPSGSNNVKYNTAFYGQAVSGSAYPWCAVFVWWVFKQSNALSLFRGGSATATVKDIYTYYNARGMVYTAPKAGDIVVFDSPDFIRHTAIVESVNGSTYTTIDGNSSNMVKRNTHTVDGTALFCRPAYDGATSGGSTGNSGGTTTYPTLSSGSSGSDVKEMQKKLLLLHYDCGSAGADGDFGSGTLAAVKAFQSANGLTVDGVCGPNTHAKLNSKYNALGVFTAVCNLADLKVRTGDSTNYAIFSSYPKLAKGEEVLVAETTANNWYFALVGNRYAAYMAAKYMKIA